MNICVAKCFIFSAGEAQCAGSARVRDPRRPAAMVSRALLSLFTRIDLLVTRVRIYRFGGGGGTLKAIESDATRRATLVAG